MNLQDRINGCLAEKGAKKTELATAVKSPRATISDWTSGKTKSLSGDKLILAAAFFNVNPEWLSTGKGSKFLAQLDVNVAEINDKKGLVPLISWVNAGAFCEAIDGFHPGDADDWFPCPERHSESTFALRVSGDSMTSPHPNEKSYPNGAIIYCDPSVEAFSGRRVIAKRPSMDEATFKEYRIVDGAHYLKPLNPAYKTIEMDETTRICAVVIGSYMPE